VSACLTCSGEHRTSEHCDWPGCQVHPGQHQRPAAPANVGSMALDQRLAAELAKAGKKTDEWREKRDELIRLAHVDGASLREIAAAVGLSNPGVLRILRKGANEAPPLMAESDQERDREAPS
jgi:hypothetical protein